MRRTLVAFLAASVALQGCGGTAFRLPLVTEGEAMRAAAEVNAAPDLHEYARSDDEYRAMITRIGARLRRDVAPLCQWAETSECRFQFHYVPDDEVNAFTAAGGEITLHRGLLLYLASEEEIAAVMAHEMGHQIADHILEGTGSTMIGVLLGALLLGGAAAAGGGTASDVDVMASSGMMLGAAVGRLSFSKEQEREADLSPPMSWPAPITISTVRPAHSRS